MTELTNAVTNGVFDTAQETVATAPVIESVTAYTGTVAELVGESKKYKTLEALAASVTFKDEFIETLKREKQEIADKLEKSNKSDEVYNELLRNKDPQVDKPSVSLEDTNKLIDARLVQLESQRAEAANLRRANDTLVEQFGDLTKAKEFLMDKATKLGLSVEFLMQTAAKSPDAFFNVLEVNKPSNSNTGYVPSSSVNTLTMSQGVKENSKEFFDKMFISDRKRYLSPLVQKQIMELALSNKY